MVTRREGTHPLGERAFRQKPCPSLPLGTGFLGSFSALTTRSRDPLSAPRLAKKPARARGCGGLPALDNHARLVRLSVKNRLFRYATQPCFNGFYGF